MNTPLQSYLPLLYDWLSHESSLKARFISDGLGAAIEVVKALSSQ